MCGEAFIQQPANKKKSIFLLNVTQRKSRLTDVSQPCENSEQTWVRVKGEAQQAGIATCMFGRGWIVKGVAALK